MRKRIKELTLMFYMLDGSILVRICLGGFLRIRKVANVRLVLGILNNA